MLMLELLRKSRSAVPANFKVPPLIVVVPVYEAALILSSSCPVPSFVKPAVLVLESAVPNVTFWPLVSILMAAVVLLRMRVL